MTWLFLARVGNRSEILFNNFIADGPTPVSQLNRRSSDEFKLRNVAMTAVSSWLKLWLLPGLGPLPVAIRPGAPWPMMIARLGFAEALKHCVRLSSVSSVDWVPFLNFP